MPPATDARGFNTSAYCDQQYSQYLRTYNGAGNYITTTITAYIGLDDTGSQTGKIVTQSYSTTTVTRTPDAYKAYQLGGAKPPCCRQCQIVAGTIQFFWWPGLADATATATASQYMTKPANNNNTSAPVTAVAANGFVFTSPSVYMAFSSLYATNLCGTVGSAWSSTTIGFHPTEISTVNPYKMTYTGYGVVTYSGTTETAINDLRGTRLPPSPLQYTDLAQNCSTISGYVYFPGNPQNDVKGGLDRDPCHPVIALPTGLISMQQAWVDASCVARDGQGAYDPPIALTPAPSADQPTLPARPGSASTRVPASQTAVYTALPDSKPTPGKGNVYGAPSWSGSPAAGGGANIAIGHAPSTAHVQVYTIIEVTTDRAGSARTMMRTTEAVELPATTVPVPEEASSTRSGGYDVVMHSILPVSSDAQGHAEHGDDGQAAGAAYTVLRDTTLANGMATAVPVVVVLDTTPTTSNAPEHGIPDYIMNGIGQPLDYPSQATTSGSQQQQQQQQQHGRTTEASMKQIGTTATETGGRRTTTTTTSSSSSSSTTTSSSSSAAKKVPGFGFEGSSLMMMTMCWIIMMII